MISGWSKGMADGRAQGHGIILKTTGISIYENAEPGKGYYHGLMKSLSGKN